MDRELLETAARAIGIALLFSADAPACGYSYFWKSGSSVRWNSLTDDGDAFRLAVSRKVFRCHMDLFHDFYDEAIASGLDERAATRRAITRTVVAIEQATGA